MRGAGQRGQQRGGGHGRAGTTAGKGHDDQVGRQALRDDDDPEQLFEHYFGRLTLK